ncbi:MAG TPA: alpha/beta hydrolase domain-containing protein [Myxococcota bacterium]|nr:alpha/beta hydrolase domain-containing protein [Myxococcota bacterium]
MTMRNAPFCVSSRPTIGIAAAGALCLALLATPAGAAVPDPVVTGPIASTATPGDPSHNYIFFASNLDLAAQGYVEEEYFISGTANRYNTPGSCYQTQTTTGTILGSGLPYKTRIVVRRPASAAAFNGVVVVEWLNVTNDADMDQTWFQINQHLMRSGYAWVGVSAQRVGVNRLRTWNPNRYGTLDVSRRNAFGSETITNDALAYDVFSEAAQAIRAPVGIDPLGGLEPQLVIATGHSQSAACLATYVNAIQPLSHAFDAFALQGTLGDPIRVDLEVPVWKALSESDVSFFNEAQVRRPDDALFRTWEVAGTSHGDQQTYAMRVPLERRDLGTAVEDSWSCGVMPPGSAVPFRYVMAAGLDLLVRRVSEGTPMPSAAPLQTVSIFPTVVLARDGIGNALGGIRLAQMDVPTAVNTGTNTGPDPCPRQGYSRDFDAQTLAQLYPTHEGYVAQVSGAVDRNLRDGFLLAPDAQQTLHEAEQSTIGRRSCDVDGSGVIDRNDVQAIVDGIGTAAAAGDPRDADGDGHVTIFDSAACANECTFPKCAACGLLGIEPVLLLVGIRALRSRRMARRRRSC